MRISCLKINFWIKILILWFFLLAVSMKVAAEEESRILIFVSFSMPKTSLKTWLQDASLIKARVVIRGFINNSMTDTTHALYELIKDTQGGMQIDPTLFEKFNIQKVPAVVVTKATPCLPNQTCIENFVVMYGDTSLEYALKNISFQYIDSALVNDALAQLREHPHA